MLFLLCLLACVFDPGHPIDPMDNLMDKIIALEGENFEQGQTLDKQADTIKAMQGQIDVLHEEHETLKIEHEKLKADIKAALAR